MTEPAARLERYRDLIDDWDGFLAACSRPLPAVAWANPIRAAQAAGLAEATLGRSGTAPVVDLLRSRGVRVEPLAWHRHGFRFAGIDKPGHTLEHFLGLMHVQEEVSLIPALVLDARPGERVLDLCAAPGGKTAGIAVGMNNTGTLVANDVRLPRLRALRSNCERLGIANVVIRSGDGTRFPLDAGRFDRILLDVPCSCEGNVRAGSTTSSRASSFEVVGRGGLQATLLGRAWKVLRPGGTLVYSTCTFAPEENEMVLDYTLGGDARIEALEFEGLRFAAGVDHWGGHALRADCSNLARFWPHLNDTGGFTVARIRKELA